MRKRIPEARRAAELTTRLGAILCALLGLATLSATVVRAQRPQSVTVSPLPPSDYSVRPACRPRPEGARCLALKLEPDTASARAHNHPIGMTISTPATATGATVVCPRRVVREGCMGMRPEDLRGAYSLPEKATRPQTIAIVDEFDDPTAAKDLNTYDQEFNLLPCTARDECFTKVNEHGERKGLPLVNGGWAEEISMDIEVAHAVCQECHILLIEAHPPEPQAAEPIKHLEEAEDLAAARGANEISNSWVESEPAADSPAFDHQGIVITAASGDEGYLNWTGQEKQEGLVNYPASSPHVVAVGGTRLTVASGACGGRACVGGAWSEETIWNGLGPYGGRGASGGDCSDRFPAPYWQRELSNWSEMGCATNRAVADIAADADPHTGVAVYDSTPNETGEVPGWQTMGGTSLSAPLVAAMFALAGGGGGVEYPARTLYENELRMRGSLHDIKSGSNGSCTSLLTEEYTERCTAVEEGAICQERTVCVAGAGYDGASGVGTPDGIGAFEATGVPAKKEQLIEFASFAPHGEHVGEARYAVTATASSGLAVSFLSTTPSVCEIEGAALTLLSVGTCTIVASQPGDAEYQAAPQVQRSLSVGEGAQFITFTSSPPGASVVGGAPYAVSAVSSSGLAVSFSSATTSVCSVQGTTVSFTLAGTCTVKASQAGSSDYEPAADVQQSFLVSATPALVAAAPTASSGAFSFTSATAPPRTPSASFSMLGAPRVNHHSGAIAFSVLVPGTGTLSWALTFRVGAVQGTTAGCPKGQIRLKNECRPSQLVFATGQRVADEPGTLTFTANPSRQARGALRAASARKQSLRVVVALGFHPAQGGATASQARPVLDRLH
jgi:hypothetical protein